MSDVAREAGKTSPVAEGSARRVTVGLELVSLHPPILGNDHDQEWILAETREQALAAARDIYGADMLGDEEWAILAEDLSPDWLRPEPVPRDDPRYQYYADEQCHEAPLWWVKAEEGAPGAALYWRYDA